MARRGRAQEVRDEIWPPQILIPKESGNGFEQMTIEMYHGRRERIADQSFFEREIHRVTDQFGTMAHVWSTYEWNRGPDSTERGRGINSIQLYFADSRWWVSSWIFVSESIERPLPTKYLAPS